MALRDSASQQQVLPCESPGAAEQSRKEVHTHTHTCAYTRLQGQERTETGMSSM